MNEIVNLIHTCIVCNEKNYSRMILLNSGKNNIYACIEGGWGGGGGEGRNGDCCRGEGG
jgi:hypothetical protein